MEKLSSLQLLRVSLPRAVWMMQGHMWHALTSADSEGRTARPQSADGAEPDQGHMVGPDILLLILQI